MTNNQKNINLFSDTQSDFFRFSKISQDIYIRNLNFILVISMSIFFIIGLVSYKLNAIITAAVVLLYFINFFLLKKQKISFSLFKTVTFILLSVFTIAYISIHNNEKILFHLLVIPLLSYFIYSNKGILISSGVVILITSALFFSLSLYDKFETNHVLILLLAYAVETVFFYFFDRSNRLNYNTLKNISNKELVKLQLDKKLTSFVIHQIRSALTNLTVYEDLVNQQNIDKNELNRYKNLSLEAFCASLSVLEDISVNKKMNNTNCNFRQIVKKMVSFFEMQNPKLVFENYKDVNITMNDVAFQISFIKSIFMLIEIINISTTEQKVSISFEKEQVEDQVFFRLVLDKSSIYRNLKNNENSFLFDILKELLNKFEGKLNCSETNNNKFYFQLEFSKSLLKEEEVDNFEKDLEENKTEEKKYRMILAEDDEINQKIYSMGFEKYFGRIDIANNGGEVIKLMEKTRYDLVVMDLQMPKLNGIETIKKIRELEKITNGHLIVIGITANTIIYNEKDILAFGFDYYFIKPFKIKNIYNSFITSLENKKH